MKLFIVFGSFILFLALALASGVFFPLFLLMPAPLVFILVFTHKKRFGALIFAIMAILCVILFKLLKLDLFACLLILLSSIMPAISLKFMINSPSGIVLSCVGNLFSVALTFAGVYLFAGIDIPSYIVQDVSQASDQMVSSLYAVLKYPEVLSGTESIQSILATTNDTMRTFVSAEQNLAHIKSLIALILIEFSMVYIVLGGALSYILPRIFLKKSKCKVVPMFKFKLFTFPPKLSKYLLITCILAVLPEMLDLNEFKLAGVMLFGIVSIILTLEGLAVTEFFIERFISIKTLRVLIILMLLFFLSYVLMFIGLLDHFIHFRMWLLNGGKKR